MSMIPGPKFDTTINYGHLLTVLTLVITLGGGIIMNAREQAVLSARVSSLEASTKIEIARLTADSAARVAQYAPTITALNKSQDLQDERISNVVDAVKEVRAGFTAASAKLNEIGQDIAVMRVQMAVPNPNPPARLPAEYQPRGMKPAPNNPNTN